jgi:hypothetical protein
MLNFILCSFSDKMSNLKLIPSLAILICNSCSQPGNHNPVNSKEPITHNYINRYQVDTSQFSTFKWTQLADTAKYDIRYLQLNFLNYPEDSTIGQDILNFTDAIEDSSFLLTGKQEYQLYQLINDTANFSEGDCGTFHLNAGMLVFSQNKICSAIDIGCGYNQWNFSSENPRAKYGAFNDRGFKKMEELLNEINLSDHKARR